MGNSVALPLIKLSAGESGICPDAGEFIQSPSGKGIRVTIVELRSLYGDVVREGAELPPVTPVGTVQEHQTVLDP